MGETRQNLTVEIDPEDIDRETPPEITHAGAGAQRASLGTCRCSGSGKKPQGFILRCLCGVSVFRFFAPRFFWNVIIVELLRIDDLSSAPRLHPP